MLLAIIWLWRGTLFHAKWLLWLLMLSFPLPYVANIAGWLTAEVGRQPWLVYGLMRTSQGYSQFVSTGNTLFTLLGFMGLYAILSILFVFLIYAELARGPQRTPAAGIHTGAPVSAA